MQQSLKAKLKGKPEIPSICDLTWIEHLGLLRSRQEWDTDCGAIMKLSSHPNPNEAYFLVLLTGHPLNQNFVEFVRAHYGTAPDSTSR